MSTATAASDPGPRARSMHHGSLLLPETPTRTSVDHSVERALGRCAGAQCPGRAAARRARRARARSRHRSATAAALSGMRPGASPSAPPPVELGELAEQTLVDARGRAAPEHTVPPDRPAASRSRDRSAAAPCRPGRRPPGRPGSDHGSGPGRSARDRSPYRSRFGATTPTCESRKLMNSPLASTASTQHLAGRRPGAPRRGDRVAPGAAAQRPAR